MIPNQVLLIREQLIQWRRDFHQHPELGYQETRTAKIVEQTLNEFGIKTQRAGATGILGTLHGSKPGKVLALRADMDALPITEENTHNYCSLSPGVMHACAHDGHTAILLGVAKYFAQNASLLKGTLRFIFQPAEEGFMGAIPTIAAGALENPKADACLGLHLWSPLEVGNVSIQSGPVMAACNEVCIEIKGYGGHAAKPHETVDSIVVASHFINSLQTLVSRNLNPLNPGVITISSIHGGTSFNIIPPSVKMIGTIRAMTSEDYELLKKRVQQLLSGICTAYGATYTLTFTNEGPVVNNDPQLTHLISQTICEFLGKDHVHSGQTMGSEDFAFYGQHVPSCFFFVGAGNKNKGIIYPHHHPLFDIDEDSLLLGAQLLITTSENFLGMN